MKMRTIVCILIGLLGCNLASSQVVKDSVKIYFHQGKHELDPDFKTNRKMLDWIDRSVFRLKKVEVVGSASPEGSVPLNKRLSEKRAQVLFDYLSRYGNLADSLKTTRFLGRDWHGLLRLVKADSKVPFQQESAALIEEIIRMEKAGVNPDSFWRLVKFRKGKPYRYMYYHLFPELRASQVLLLHWEAPEPVGQPSHTLTMERPDFQNSRIPFMQPDYSGVKSFCWALKTNALYDVLLVPNVGVEFCIDKNWSVGTNWMYAWWKNDVNRRWRVYGGDVYARRWFGRKANAKPLTGHHVGVYAQALTYDFCLDEKGYMGGKPGGNLWDKLHYAFGVEYGYSLPIARRLNLDFALGVGYMGGTYHEYRVMDDCKVWQATKNRRWFGPTKAEVSLVWLLNTFNINKKKGGAR